MCGKEWKSEDGLKYFIIIVLQQGRDDMGGLDGGAEQVPNGSAEIRLSWQELSHYKVI